MLDSSLRAGCVGFSLWINPTHYELRFRHRRADPENLTYGPFGVASILMDSG